MTKKVIKNGPKMKGNQEKLTLIHGMELSIFPKKNRKSYFRVINKSITSIDDGGSMSMF